MMNLTAYSEFNFIFEPITEGVWAVKTKHDNRPVLAAYGDEPIPYLIDEANLNKNIAINENDALIIEEFNSFKKNRPEYIVGAKLEVPENVSLQWLHDTYCNLLIGCAMIRAAKNGYDPDEQLPRIMRIIKMLEETDFFTSPASSVFHGSFSGGLVAHSIEVVQCIKSLKSSIPAWREEVTMDSAVLVALVHDWCKIGTYESYQRNVKDPQTGTWVSKLAYRKIPSIMPLGHGVESLFLASKYFKLSDAEALAIRWHMGPWRCVESEHNDLQESNENYPIVHLLQFADQLSITKYIGKVYEQ